MKLYKSSLSHDRAIALKFYARQRKDPEMYVWLSEIELRARGRIGELWKALEKRERLRSTPGQQNKTEALKAAGISHAESFRCEKIAEIPEQEFEQFK
jgi:hypothetical protein